MTKLRKKAITRLILCAVALIACIVFSVLLLTGTFDGKSEPAADASVSDVTSDQPESVDTAPEQPAEEQPAEEQPAEPQPEEPAAEPEPEPTPEPATFDGLSEQPTTIYNEGEQPTYTVTPDSNMNLRAGPSTDAEKLGSVPASTTVTALGTNADGSWVVVQYNGTYGWLTTEYLNAA